MKKDKKKIILSVVGLVLLVVLVIGITYAAFTYTKKGQVENTVRTGKITMDYQEAENGITLENAYPIEDSVGKVISNQDQVFNFTVNINLYGNNLPISFEVTGEKDENSTLSDEDIRIYLEKSTSGTNYTSVLEPTGFIPLTADDEFGAKAGEMVLEKGSTNDSVTFNYRLRMWVGESYKVTGEEKYFTMKVNVYGNDGVTVEVKGIELDTSSATLKLTDTLQLNAKTLPASPTDKSISWTSSNERIASVTSSGLVTAKGMGTAVITATSSNGKNATASIKVEANNKNITAAYLENGAWTPGSSITYKVNDTTTQNFYVLKDNGTSLTLITDTSIVIGAAYDSSGSNVNGPRTATQALENATNTWTNVDTNTYNESIGIATKARLITKEEAETVGCKENISNSCPTWIVDSDRSYWTSTATEGYAPAAFEVRPRGDVSAEGCHVSVNTGQVGSRAVVNISK